MLKIYKPEEAQKSLLKRNPLDDMSVSARLLDGIQALFGEPLSPEEAVKKILNEVRSEGDLALRKWSKILDGYDSDTFRIPKELIEKAASEVPDEILRALELSKERIHEFYKNQPLNSWIMQNKDGTMGQLVRPIDRVGLYIPGGTAPLPSTVLMSAIPAKVAGVKAIVMVVPPERNSRANYTGSGSAAGH